MRKMETRERGELEALGRKMLEAKETNRLHTAERGELEAEVR